MPKKVVYRVQHRDTGIGPYKSGLCLGPKFNHLLQPWCWMSGLAVEEEFFFAFSSKRHLDRVLPKEQREPLRNAGFEFVRRVVPREECHFSPDGQVAVPKKYFLKKEKIRELSEAQNLQERYFAAFPFPGQIFRLDQGE